MLTYATQAEAYRDTTKWLATSVPVAGLVAAGLATGPALVRSVQTTTGSWAWLEDHWLVLVCWAVIAGCVVAILWSGARVLATEPEPMDELLYGDAKSDTAAAIGAGVAVPHYLDKSTFDAELDTWTAERTSANPPAADDPRAVRLAAAVEAVRAWSAFRQVQGPYLRFRVVFVLAVLAMLGAILLAPVQLDATAALGKPTPVEVEVSEAGAAALLADTGCLRPSRSTFTAVGGTWARPVLAVDGRGCRFDATWVPDPAHVEVRPAK